MIQVEASFIREILQVASSPEVVSLAGGLPRDDLFPVEAFAAACDAVLATRGSRALQYATSAGFDPLREWIAHRMSVVHGVATSRDEILVTTGSQQALDLCAKLFSDGAVAMENPGYLGAILAFRANGVDPIPITVGLDGPDIDDIARAAQMGARLLYGMSRHQNPRGTSYGPEAGNTLVEHLEKRELFMIEDDPYGEIDFGESADRAPLLVERSPQRILYCGSFSKSVAPSIRIGFVRGPADIIRRLERLKQAADLHTSGFLQMALHHMLTEQTFVFDDHLSEIRRTYRSQRDALLAAVADHLPEATVSHIPTGGMFLWLALDVSTSQLFDRAIAQHVAFVPGRYFYLDSTPPDTEMRLNFSNTEPNDLRVAVERIAQARRAAFSPSPR